MMNLASYPRPRPPLFQDLHLSSFRLLLPRCHREELLQPLQEQAFQVSPLMQEALEAAWKKKAIHNRNEELFQKANSSSYFEGKLVTGSFLWSKLFKTLITVLQKAKSVHPEQHI